MELPPPWELRESQNYPGRAYYYNKVTNESTWIRPIPYPGNPIEWPPAIFVVEILIKHKDSHDNTSWRGRVERTQEEALKKIKSIVKDIVSGEHTFEEMANQHSDSESHSKNGIVGWVKKGEKPIEFEEIAWQLRIGEMSPPTLTDDGYYIILRRG